jgi:hypothetical protein
MQKSSSRFGQPVLVYISIIYAALVGLTLTSFRDGSSGSGRAMTFINIFFRESSDTVGGLFPCLATQIYI